jgi:manganese efflux pump family protein
MIAELLILGAIIGSNNFATSLALGSLGREILRWRIIAVFGLFEFFVPLFGLWLGQRVSEAAAGSLDWLGPTLLAALGAWTVYSAFLTQQQAERLASRVTSWSGLLAMSAGLSIDNLIVGFSLGLGEVEPLVLAATIAGFSMAFAFLGLRLGARAREIHRRSAVATTGVLLIALAVALASGVF